MARAPKNGHTTHLLLSFPRMLPRARKLIAEVWAFEMFQSGAHQAEEWAAYGALHSDRAHPHVHVVVNNRGLMDGQWFYMAREHAFNLDMMKTRMVEIAAEEGVSGRHLAG
ncbi:relaxase/mobilization nuclease domain-containing protein (plasmid) [Rhodobacter capsulatus]